MIAEFGKLDPQDRLFHREDNIRIGRRCLELAYLQIAVGPREIYKESTVGFVLRMESQAKKDALAVGGRKGRNVQKHARYIRTSLHYTIHPRPLDKEDPFRPGDGVRQKDRCR